MAPIWIAGRPKKLTGLMTIEFAETTDALRAGYESRSTDIDLQRCCHCRRMFKISRGSGRRRGWCVHHAEITCGRPQCLTCKGDNNR